MNLNVSMSNSASRCISTISLRIYENTRAPLQGLVKALMLKPSRINRAIRKLSSSVKNLIPGKRANMERTFVRETANIVNDALKRAVFPENLFTSRS